MNNEPTTPEFMNELYETIKSRRNGNINKSYTAQLFDKGVAHITQKIGEESTEVIVAALNETPAQVISESADLIFHLMVLWVEKDISLDAIFNELEGRSRASGIREKSALKSEK